MSKKLIVAVSILLASSTFLAGCSLFDFSDENGVSVNQPETNQAEVTMVTPEPSLSKSTDVMTLEAELGNIELESETFE